ncbi:MAG: AmmeMemoRadiSam system protein A [Gammaproteobacteria bacterium]
MTLDASARTTLLKAARQTIEHNLIGDESAFENNNQNPVLRQPHASFVTLKRHGVLRGCIGTLEPKRPLLDDVIHNAMAAAFKDPRFPPLTVPELESLHIEISVLSAAEPINARDRAELLRVLKPGRDGLIVQEGKLRATFLPAVWTSLTDPGTFYEELMKKSGLGIDHWSSDLKFFRYHAESFEQES